MSANRAHVSPGRAPAILLAALFALGATRPAASRPSPPRTPTPLSYFGYGWNVANFARWQPASGQSQYPPSSFNWFKITDEPGDPAWLCNQFRLDYNVLLRLNKAKAGASAAEVGDNALYWAQSMYNGGNKCVEAFEISNEPNLVGMYGGRIDAAAYTAQLCAAYTAIKSVSSDFIVVSAGLAPTGGNNPDYAVDEEIYTRAMLDAGAANCFDVFGYHNYGFRTGYATDPDDPVNCPDGMCFRGVERIRGILAGEYAVTKDLWTTEFGWMRDFVAGGCGDAPWAGTFAGFPVSDQAQADNLVGAFQYARANWSWMGAMFVFNLDFNTAPWYPDPCVSDVVWFGVKEHVAESALEAMPKDFGLACYDLTGAVFAGIGGAITADPAPTCNGGAGYRAGTGVQLTAVASPGYAFDHWSGDLSGSANPAALTMDAPHAVTAHFATSPPTTFFDVPAVHWAHNYIESLYASGITGGCATDPALLYCPEASVTRAQMAIFLLRGVHGAAYQPPPATGAMFDDVSAGYWAAAWIEQLAREGITGGCGPGLYCPETAVTRAQMAVFLLRSKYTSNYLPPPASGDMFTDVPINYWAAAWIEQLAREGITGGCGPGLYCPETAVTRAQMAVFLVRTFNLP